MEQVICRSSDQKAKVASVLLFTDGLANRGIKGLKDIIDAMRDPIGSLAKPGVLDNAPGGGARPLVSMSLFGLLYFVTINRSQDHLILTTQCRYSSKLHHKHFYQWMTCLQELWSV